MERRHFDWDGALNARDLGGLPTVDGGRTRYGVLFRSDSTSTLSDHGRRDLVGHGVRTIVDLRSARELEKEPNPFAAVDGIEYRHMPFNDPVVEARLETMDSPPDRYETMIEMSGARIAAIFDALASGPRSVLFHCMAGRDRTGLVAALALSLAGVPDGEIEDDYLLTDARMQPRYEAWRVELDEVRLERFRRSEREARQSIRSALARVRAGWGGVAAYLAAHGAAVAAVERLRAELVDAER